MDRPIFLPTDGAGIAVPVDRAAIARVVAEQRIDLRTASIREVSRLIDAFQASLALRFVRMELGIPGRPTSPIAIEAEVRALREGGVAHVYAPFDGLPALKAEAARFVELFMNVRVPPASCLPTIGAMEGCFAALALAGRLDRNRRTVLLLDPGFPVNRLQARFLGLPVDSLDFYDYRGSALVEAIERRAERGDLCAVLWSSPNNPSWITLQEAELEGIGRACDRHGLVAIEDLAYFGMDVRRGPPRPGRPPFQPTVLRYTRRGITLISSSKMFSYAGQRIGIAVLSLELFEQEAPDLVEHCGTANVGHAFAHGILYPITACVPESPQHGLLALLRAANEGDASLFEPALEYARRAQAMKRIFLENGFRLVYDNDLGEPLADGFYFTVAHPAFDDGLELMTELFRYGVSAIPLGTTGSRRIDGLRACVSLVDPETLALFESRIRRFREDHSR